MIVRAIKLLALLAASGMYWQLACHMTGAREPWDAEAYWRLWYPFSFILAAITGCFFGKDGWLAGGIITFAQLPVMWINNGTGALVAVGVILLGILAVPAAAISLLTGRLAMRFRSARPSAKAARPDV